MDLDGLGGFQILTAAATPILRASIRATGSVVAQLLATVVVRGLTCHSDGDSKTAPCRRRQEACVGSVVYTLVNNAGFHVGAISS